MDSVDLIRRLHQHRVWSNGRLRRAAAGLTDQQLRQRFEMGCGTLLATLIHLYGAEYSWLEALHGRGDVPLAGEDAFESLEELQIAWTALDRRWERYLDELRPARLALPVHRRGKVTPAFDILLHLCTHAQYTTAQAVNMLRRLDAPIPDTQLITMSRQENDR